MSSAQTSPEGPASVNAIEQTYVIVILAYFTLFQPNTHRKHCKDIHIIIIVT